MDYVLENFVVGRILSEDSRQKAAAILGSFKGSGGQAIVLITKRQLLVDQLQTTIAGVTALDLQFRNDVYSKYAAALPEYEGFANLDIIYPATEKHISKYSDQKYILVQESPETYKEITEPYIHSIPDNRLQWVHNILEGKAEAERVVFSDKDQESGFTLLVDQKWDQKQPQGLYLQAIVARKDIHSLRDLRKEHIPLLKFIRKQTRLAVRARYAVERGELRMWIHYQPSYYHLHVHVAHSKWEGAGLQAGKAVLLDDVIDNLEIDAKYYVKRTLTFSLGENDPLFEAFNARGLTT